MSGEKPETEDTTSRPKSLSDEALPPKSAETTSSEEPTAKTGETSEKVSVLEGLSTLKPRAVGKTDSETTKLSPSATDLPGKASLGIDPASTQDEPASAESTTEAHKEPVPLAGPKLPPAADKGIDSPAPKSAVDKDPVKPTETSTKRPEVVMPPPAPAPQSPRRGGVMAPLLGGVLAAGLGFGLAHFVPEGWPIGPGSERFSALQRQIEAQETRIAELSARAPQAPDETLAPRLAALEEKAGQPTDLSTLEAEIAALKSSLSTLPEGAAPADLGPLRSEFAEQLAALRAEIDAIPRSNPADLDALRQAAQAEREAIEARAEATRAEAETTARTAMVRGAVLRLQAALETGASFDAALSDLGAVGIALPEALSAHAAGVPALSTLQSQFPEAARNALAASSKPGPEAGMGDRFAAFLSAQTGLRSLTPQEGSSPDAVLSRAEAAVTAGDLAKALTELAALPPEGAAAFTDWRAGAEARLAASAAAQNLIADLDKP